MQHGEATTQRGHGGSQHDQIGASHQRLHIAAGNLQPCRKGDAGQIAGILSGRLHLGSLRSIACPQVHRMARGCIHGQGRTPGASADN
ncbi:hypothetical protein D3C72_996230 [compost metagenome]